MGKVVVSEFVTLDGVFEDPAGAEGFDRGGWAFELLGGGPAAKLRLAGTQKVGETVILTYVR